MIWNCNKNPLTACAVSCTLYLAKSKASNPMFTSWILCSCLLSFFSTLTSCFSFLFVDPSHINDRMLYRNFDSPIGKTNYVHYSRLNYFLYSFSSLSIALRYLLQRHVLGSWQLKRNGLLGRCRLPAQKYLGVVNFGGFSSSFDTD